jgi:hypothetical protein
MFQIVRCTLDEKGEAMIRCPLEPPYELREDAAAMAEFDCCRLGDDYGYDEARDCWWVKDARGRMFRFEIESVAAIDVAA